MPDSIEWAVPDDLRAADLEGVSGGIEEESLVYWLGRARRAILAEAPVAVLVQRILTGGVDRDAPRDVQIDLALGKLANPGGVRTVQESNGPSSGSITYGGDTPGQLFLSAHHRKVLGISSVGTQVAGTVDTWR